MKILVLGATGGTGREIVRAAQAKGHSVVALVRSREKAHALAGATIIEGNALDESAVYAALDDVDGVVSTLGTGISLFKEVTLLSRATKVLLAAMQARKVRRLVVITGVGAGDSKGHGGFFYDRLFQPLLLRKVYEDKDRQEAMVRSSGLDWVLVRPTILNDGPASGPVQALTDLSGFHGGAIARKDVADFVVEQLTSDRWLHQSPLITG